MDYSKYDGCYIKLIDLMTISDSNSKFVDKLLETYPDGTTYTFNFYTRYVVRTRDWLQSSTHPLKIHVSLNNYNDKCTLKLTPYQYSIIKQIMNDDKSIANIPIKIYNDYYSSNTQYNTQYNTGDECSCQIL
jgi:hypothetical protein